MSSSSYTFIFAVTHQLNQRINRLDGIGAGKLTNTMLILWAPNGITRLTERRLASFCAIIRGLRHF